MSNKKERIESIDVLRGLTVAGMILVNNGHGESFQMLRHSVWNGLTPCDLVFPFFLFIMGVSAYISLGKGGFRPSAAVVGRVLRRTAVLFAIGLALNWAELAAHGEALQLGHLRLWGVMQRIALCYLAVSLFALYVPHRLVLPVVAALLAAYGVLLVAGHGYDYNAATNILARADLRLFGYDHLYHKSPVDPEGLLGTISATAHVLIGFWCGGVLRREKPIELRAQSIFVAGTLLAVGGYLLSYGLPLNKRVWSPSYVLATCGMASLLLATLTVRPLPRRASLPFLVFGTNALALYVGSELLAIVFGATGTGQALFNVLHAAVPAPKWASLAYALTFVLINYAMGWWLWRRRIFIKL